MSPPPPPTTTTLTPSLPRPPTLSLHHSPRFTLPFTLSLTTTTKPLNQTIPKHRHVSLRPLKSLDNTKQTANTSPEEQQSQPPQPPEEEEEEEEGSSAAAEAVGKEVRRLMEEREKEREGNWWSGVGEEVREIEWPAFGKVLGTTGVVLAIIAGSSVVLLSVNAVFAELSGRVFAGHGVLDFFG